MDEPLVELETDISDPRSACACQSAPSPRSVSMPARRSRRNAAVLEMMEAGDAPAAFWPKRRLRLRLRQRQTGRDLHRCALSGPCTCALLLQPHPPPKPPGSCPKMPSRPQRKAIRPGKATAARHLVSQPAAPALRRQGRRSAAASAAAAREEIVPMSRLRQTIARRLKEARTPRPCSPPSTMST